ncbi:unnamed protein product [Gongylonema pulchrum]|uniref:Transposase n=1 Tax=Gongylonema pulchrum TaxID=637853 RepID=A0A183E6C4_9BILA|nr:unnamed protein product [Gongylonema pulchrum]
MPKVIAGCGEWRPVQIAGDLVGDENLAFLSAVEECLPVEVDGSGGASRPKACFFLKTLLVVIVERPV